MPALLFTKLGISPKIGFAIHMMIYATVPITFFERYIFNDWELFKSVFIALMFNGATDLLATMIRRDKVLIKTLRDFVMIFLAIIMVMVALGIYDNTMIGGEPVTLKDFATSSAYAGLMGFIMASSLWNIYRIFQSQSLKEVMLKMGIWPTQKPTNEKN